MFKRLAGVNASRYIQNAAELLAVLLALVWVAVIAFVLLQGAYQVGALLILFTILIAGVAYANERPD